MCAQLWTWKLHNHSALSGKILIFLSWMAHFNLTWELSLCDIQLFLSVGLRISSTVLHSITFQISIKKISFDPIYLRQSSFLKFTRGNGQNHCHIATENLNKDQKGVHTSNPISQKGNFPSGLMFCPHLESRCYLVITLLSSFAFQTINQY